MTSYCDQWHTNKTINPRTGRTIKVGSPLYKKLERECDTIVRKAHTSICDEWRINKTINPRTGRTIKVKSPLYNKLE